MRIGFGGELGTETGPKCQRAARFQIGRLTSLRIRLILKSHFLPAWNTNLSLAKEHRTAGYRPLTQERPAHPA